MFSLRDLFAKKPEPRVHVIEPVQRTRLVGVPTFLKTGKWVEWGGNDIGILVEVGVPESTVRVVFVDGSEGDLARVPTGSLNLTVLEKIPFPRRASMTDDDLRARGY